MDTQGSREGQLVRDLLLPLVVMQVMVARLAFLQVMDWLGQKDLAVVAVAQASPVRCLVMAAQVEMDT
ncbi:MAG: hypothetical protein AB2604_10540 [Candidatus Thiodiazotropha taylori]